MEFPELSPALRAARLAAPKGKVRMVLDTDTYNEVDDQFAVVQWLLSPDRLGIEAIYAAPFHNNRSDGDGDGMQKSYEEIRPRVLRTGGRLVFFRGRMSRKKARRRMTL
jgi:purine nucleosidase